MLSSCSFLFFSFLFFSFLCFFGCWLAKDVRVHALESIGTVCSRAMRSRPLLCQWVCLGFFLSLLCVCVSLSLSVSRMTTLKATVAAPTPARSIGPAVLPFRRMNTPPIFKESTKSHSFHRPAMLSSPCRGQP